MSRPRSIANFLDNIGVSLFFTLRCEDVLVFSGIARRRPAFAGEVFDEKIDAIIAPPHAILDHHGRDTKYAARHSALTIRPIAGCGPFGIQKGE